MGACTQRPFTTNRYPVSTRAEDAPGAGPFDGHRKRSRILTSKAVIAVGTGASIVLLLLFLWRAASVLLLLFAGLLVAVFMSGSATALSDRTRLSYGWSLAAVLFGLIAFFVGTGWLLAPQIASQISELSETLPQSVASLESFLNQYPWGRYLTRSMPSPDEIMSNDAVWSRLTGIFSTALGVVANSLFILTVGIYLAATPNLYRRGIVRLVPISKRERAGEVIDALGKALWGWLVGTLISMALIGLLSWLGLMILGVPLSIALGFIAALLEFIPIIGPWLSAIPAVLVAFMTSPTKAVYVALLYLGIQQVEGNLITPIVMRKAVSLPPVLTLSATVIAGLFFGLPGVFLATPLAVVVMVLVRMLYVEDVLGDRMDDPAKADVHRSR